MNYCPGGCKSVITHSKYHGDHVMECDKCNIIYCYSCFYVFRKRTNSANSSSTSLCSCCDVSNKYIAKHYKYSNCKQLCDKYCMCIYCKDCIALGRKNKIIDLLNTFHCKLCRCSTCIISS